ncbi:Biogenesis of lysosome-related organelles complex 1 subunit 7 [Caenorhabditis elegans]|uniref:Biogenesis of lysosome-related organelles complex 1 subunit 6 n=2 Tax=Caenorhabditis elegans TaxID=6239 RepID=BL1S6_CAEEL|nr:Biogenesis of lysosome-related organelles complex 1 subunit 7 [Caenorhabditis elegans]O01822.5 RecName: Full=Biogenesis of lysosome-related organelles complex 1 subunit 6; Short=BLOC-1 subunit 6; AltName: Full=Pallid protein homolog [Caenorhabditis elegans]AFQ55889.1 GLO-2.a [Caenorhabditis elegans]CCU83355.1 Biogenesis of lysosome-related organelles complex 1 subunit 7 [Caenorhabditis elegans]|eukprot:NP_001293460.1 Biogenesis of lysosome-related organelles complex 1 subunit 6 [Caenorhabditis elegans]
MSNTEHNVESKNVTDTLDEILRLQEDIQARIGSSNHNLETNFESIKDFVSRAHAYIPILNQISKDMIEICERTQALKKKTSQLELSDTNIEDGSTTSTPTTTNKSQ